MKIKQIITRTPSILLETTVKKINKKIHHTESAEIKEKNSEVSKIIFNTREL